MIIHIHQYLRVRVVRAMATGCATPSPHWTPVSSWTLGLRASTRWPCAAYCRLVTASRGWLRGSLMTAGYSIYWGCCMSKRDCWLRQRRLFASEVVHVYLLSSMCVHSTASCMYGTHHQTCTLYVHVLYYMCVCTYTCTLSLLCTATFTLLPSPHRAGELVGNATQCEAVTINRARLLR